MSIQGKKAFFDTLPGSLVLNSLWIPGKGGSHLIMGQSDSKMGALHALHQHLTNIYNWKPLENTDKPLHEQWDWQEIPFRDEDPGSRSAIGGRMPSELPIRSQRGVMARPIENCTVSVYNDDYATGSIPWTIRITRENDNVEAQHKKIKEYFEGLGNQKTSWQSFKVIR